MTIRTVFVTGLSAVLLCGLALGGGTRNQDRTMQGNNQFAFDLFEKFTAEDFGENIFFSPLSISMALAMVYNGADGDTKAAMADALALEGIEIEQVNRAFKTIMTDLPADDPFVKMEIANSIWARDGISFDANYLQQVEDFYQAELTTLDFGARSSVDRINAWVSDKTHEKIDKIIAELSPDDVMILINAIYFKGTWGMQFDPGKTRDREFHLLDGSVINHPLMHLKRKIEYYQGEDFQAVSLPYGENKISMYVLLPSEDVSYKNFLDSMTHENWDSWIGRLHKREGTIALPKFTLEYEKTLNDILKALGMEVAFNPTMADFSKMNGDPDQGKIFISEVRHKTFVEVNEEGTEAAAVTSVRMKLASAMPEPPFEMIVDRPFVIAIRDNETGTLLFMGAIVNPA